MHCELKTQNFMQMVNLDPIYLQIQNVILSFNSRDPVIETDTIPLCFINTLWHDNRKPYVTSKQFLTYKSMLFCTYDSKFQQL